MSLPRALILSVSLMVAGALVLSGLPGCGGGSSGGTTGLLQVGVTDLSGNVSSLVVTIREIRVVPAGQEEEATGVGLPLIATFVAPQPIDIMQLQYQQQLLGENQVPAGAYSQVRLVLEPNPPGAPVNYLIYASDLNTMVPLKTPSGQQSGLKILGQFEVAAGVINAIVLDFDPAKAVVTAGKSGQTLLKPTGIRITKVAEILASYGGIGGAVLPEDAQATAMVSVIPVGESAAIAQGSVNPDDGSFRAGVPSGEYYLVVTADGYPTFDSSLLSPAKTYQVVAGEDTDAGVIDLT